MRGRLGIRGKIRLIILGTSAVILALACTALYLLSVDVFRTNKLDQLDSVAKIVAANIAAPLVFDMRDDGLEVLAPVIADDEILGCLVLDAQGEAFALVTKKGQAAWNPPMPKSMDAEVEADAIVVKKPVVVNGERIGTVLLRGDRKSETAVRSRLIVISFLLGLSLLAVAYALATRLSRVISEPVSRLAESMRSIAEEKDFSIRVERCSNDEHGDLVDYFNDMLGRIEERDRDLAAHRDNLEREVARRTRELVEANRDLVEAKERAEAGTRAKSEFLANMSHEIRTPMNSVLGMCEILEGTSLSREQEHCVKTLKGAGESLLDLINGILDLAKVESGSIDLESIPFSLDRVVKGTADLMRIAADRKGIHLEVDFETAEDSVVTGDPLRLRQVLLNLIGNAIKFTAEGSVTLSVRRERGDVYSFRVTDTGIGIAKDDLTKLFRPFSQVDSTTARKYGGTGLGLVLSERLVRLMGGTINVTSQLGRGTAMDFALYLPAASEEAIELTQPTEADSGTGNLPRTVLLVDDTRDNRFIVKTFLEKVGIQVSECENGLAAIERIKLEQFDCILMDMQMPLMDGYEATRRIREFEETTGRDRVPILALTADAMVEDRERAIRAGCDGHISKPVAKKTLIETIRQHQRSPAGKA